MLRLFLAQSGPSGEYLNCALNTFLPVPTAVPTGPELAALERGRLQRACIQIACLRLRCGRRAHPRCQAGSTLFLASTVQEGVTAPNA